MATWSAIIPAAGQGKRFSSRGEIKQFLQVADRPILAHTLSHFLRVPAFSEIVIATSKEGNAFIQEILNRYFSSSIDKFKVVAGGETRGHSVCKGLEAATGDFAAIHDAARPCLSQQLIERLMIHAEEHGSAVPGYPVYDTVKRSYDGEAVKETVDREGLWLVQTPQCFRRELVLKAYQQVLMEKAACTDDASAVEYSGGKVSLVRGEITNIKVTFPDDLKLAELYIRNGHV